MRAAAAARCAPWRSATNNVPATRSAMPARRSTAPHRPRPPTAGTKARRGPSRSPSRPSASPSSAGRGSWVRALGRRSRASPRWEGPFELATSAAPGRGLDPRARRRHRGGGRPARGRRLAAALARPAARRRSRAWPGGPACASTPYGSPSATLTSVRLGLTPRERTVLSWPEGHTDRAIGESLFISERPRASMSSPSCQLGVVARRGGDGPHRLGLVSPPAPRRAPAKVPPVRHASSPGPPSAARRSSAPEAALDRPEATRRPRVRGRRPASADAAAARARAPRPRPPRARAAPRLPALPRHGLPYAPIAAALRGPARDF